MPRERSIKNILTKNKIWQSGVGVYMVWWQVGAEGEEPRAVVWFMEVVLWISALHAVVTIKKKSKKLRPTHGGGLMDLSVKRPSTVQKRPSTVQKKPSTVQKRPST